MTDKPSITERIDSFVRAQLLKPVTFIWNKTGKNHYMQAHYLTTAGTVGWLTEAAHDYTSVPGWGLKVVIGLCMPIMVGMSYVWANEYAKAAKMIAGKEDTHRYVFHHAPTKYRDRVFWLWSGIFWGGQRLLFLALLDRSYADCIADIGALVWWMTPYSAAAVASLTLPPRKHKEQELPSNMRLARGNA